jgi:ligand-binding sensor domain-containing protein
MFIPVTRGSNFFMTGKAAAPTQVWSIMQDRTGTIWFGTNEDGVLRYDGKTFTRFLDGNGVVNEQGLRLNNVNGILQDKVGNVWFATWFEGLCRYDGKSVVSFKPHGEVWYQSMMNDKEGKETCGLADGRKACFILTPWCRFGPARLPSRT